MVMKLPVTFGLRCSRVQVGPDQPYQLLHLRYIQPFWVLITEYYLLHLYFLCYKQGVLILSVEVPRLILALLTLYHGSWLQMTLLSNYSGPTSVIQHIKHQAPTQNIAPNVLDVIRTFGRLFEPLCGISYPSDQTPAMIDQEATLEFLKKITSNTATEQPRAHQCLLQGFKRDGAAPWPISAE